MQYRPLGESELCVSVIGLGTMSWPGCLHGQSGYEGTSEDARLTAEMVYTALDHGITLIDTAQSYGRGLAEDFVGRALKEAKRRDEAIIVTKTGPLFAEEVVGDRTCDLSEANIIKRCEDSLRRLRTDHIDLLLAHWPDPSTPIEETMRAAAKLQKQGKIRAFGVSNFDNDLLDLALKFGPVAANQLPYSLADRGIDADKRPFCVERHVGIMAYSPMGKGVLSGKYDASHLPPDEDYRHQRKYFAKENLPRFLALAQRLRELAPECSCTPAQLAVAWVIARPGITVALPGAKTPDQVRANAAAGSVRVPAEVMNELDRISESEADA